MSEQKIEIVQGDGKELDISKVSDHLSITKPKKKEKKENIVIPGKQEEKKWIECYLLKES